MNKKLKILTFYSDSHFEMYNNFFLPSYNKFLSENELISKKIDQISPTGEYESEGFDYAMVEKLNLIIENIDLKDDRFLVYSDCDVQFFSNLKFDLGGNDIAFQQDGSVRNLCTGFFIAKQNPSVLNFFKEARELLLKNLNGKIHDQTIINRMFNSGYNKIKKTILPYDKYWTVTYAINGGIWDGSTDFEIPDNLIMHHANFTVGVKNKIKLLKLVKEKMKNKKGK